MEKPNPDNHFFLNGNSACATLARSFDWASTPLGAPSQWPQSLRHTVATLLSSEFPMLLFWGTDHIQLYNDAFRKSLGQDGKHPLAMGQRAIDCWPEIWEFLAPVISEVRETGNSVSHEDLLLPIFRNGRMEEVYWIFSFSPAYGETGSIEGVLVVCTEVTDKIVKLKNLDDSKSELEFAIEAAELGTWDLNPATGQFTSNERLKSWFGLLPDEEVPLQTATDVIAEADRQRVIDAIAAATTYESGGKYEIEYTIIHPSTGEPRIVLAKGHTWFGADKKPYRFNGTLQDITEIRQSEVKVAEARQLTDIAIKSVGIGLYRVDFVTNEFEYTPEFAAIMTGNRDHEGLDRLTIVRRIHPDDMHLRDQAVKEGIETGEFYYAPRLIWDDGSVHRIVIMGAQTNDKHGKPSSFSGTVRDITFQEQQKLALAESENRFSSMIQQAPIAMALFTGPEFKIEVANHLILNYLRKDASIIGSRYREAVPEFEAQGFFAIMDKVYTDGIAYEAFDAKADLLRDGELMSGYFNFTYTPIFDNDGKCYAIILTATDVTEQVLSRKKLEDARTALKNAIELAELATWKLDIKNNVYKYSDRFMDWLGFSENTKAADAAYNPLPPAYRESVPAAVAAVIAPGSSGVYDNEHPIVNQLTGQVRIIHANAHVYYDDEGMPEFLSGTAQDVTKERRLKQELEFLVKQRTEEIERINAELEVNNQELQQFAYIASHDLQEPVRKIAVYMQMLEHSMGTVNDKSRDYINKINSSAKRMTNLVRDVLGFSQLSGTDNQFEVVDLNDVMAEITGEFELIIEQKHAEIHYHGLPSIEAIPLQISQLVGNLVSNSLKYVSDDVRPEITVTALAPTEKELQFHGVLPHTAYCKILFSDNGIGFEQQYAEKIFTIFQRLHGKDEYVGTGIGLAMCRKITQIHHGSIHAKSAVGKGTVFTILLPVKQNA